MIRATVIHKWPDGSLTDCEFETDEPAHPDLMDSCVKRVLELYRETCGASEDEDD